MGWVEGRDYLLRKWWGKAVVDLKDLKLLLDLVHCSKDEISFPSGRRGEKARERVR